MAEPNNQVYSLSTLADFWALGDADRIDRAFKEIALGMSQARRFMDLLEGVSETQGNEGASFPIKWPERMDWTDDGGIQVGFRILGTDGSELMAMRHKLSPGFHDKPEPDDERS